MTHHLPLTLSSHHLIVLASWTWLYSPVPEVSPAVNGSHFCLGLCMVGLRTSLVGRLHLQQELTPCWLPDSDPSQKGLLLVPPLLAALSAVFWLHHGNTLASCCSRPSPGQGQGYSTMGVLPAMDLIMECLLTPGCRGVFSPKSGRGSSQRRILIAPFMQNPKLPMRLHEEVPRGWYPALSQSLSSPSRAEDESGMVLGHSGGGKLYLRQEPV